MGLSVEELQRRKEFIAEKQGKLNQLQEIQVFKGVDGEQRKALLAEIKAVQAESNFSIADRDPSKPSPGEVAKLDSDEFAPKGTVKFSALGWFIYFWKEAAAHGWGRSSEANTAIYDAFVDLFERADPPVAGLKWKVKAPLESLDAARVRGHMAKLLSIGFERFPGDGEGYNREDSSNAALFAFMRDQSALKTFEFSWRADDRPFDVVFEAEGFRSKSESAQYAKMSNMDKLWHPFSQAEYNKYLWFRKNQCDNCLYSVVSIGLSDDWKSYLGFPKLSDLQDLSTSVGAHFAGQGGRLSDMRMAKCLVDGRQQAIRLPSSVTWLYMFLWPEIVLPTNAIQKNKGTKDESFPELGVKSIPLSSIFGAIPFVRFHHGPGEADGFTAVADVLRVKDCGTSVFLRNQRFGDEGYRKLREAFDRVVETGPVSVAWTPSGYKEVDTVYTFKGKKIQVLELI